MTLTDLQEDINAAMPMEAEISNLEKRLAEKRDERDLLYTGMWDKVKRARSGIKANYGDDSQQYEKVGGTRMSERKPRARKGITTPTTES